MQFAEGKQFVFGLFAATIALGSLQPPLLPGCAHRAHALSFCYLCTVFEEHSDLGAQCFTGQQLEGQPGLRGSSVQWAGVAVDSGVVEQLEAHGMGAVREEQGLCAATAFRRLIQRRWMKNRIKVFSMARTSTITLLSCTKSTRQRNAPIVLQSPPAELPGKECQGCKQQ